MKTGILTFHLAYNYGAVLQTYALQETLVQMGVQATVLDYRAASMVAHNRPLGLRSGAFMHVLPMRWRFDRFRKRHLNLTTRLSTTEDLKEATSDYDAVVVGSDQVWNTNITKGDLNYFLAFADGIRKVSYAADFGQIDQIPQIMPDVSRLLSQFDHISVRTSLSKEVVRRLCSRDVNVVLDPTFLYDFSETAAIVKTEGPFILVYSIWAGPDREVLTSLVRRIASKYNLPVCSVSWGPGFPMADYHLRSLGPAEWLGYFREAAFICTDSYHGFIFAIKNRKPFAAVCLNNRASRIVEVADRYGLHNCIVTSAQSAKSSDMCTHEIPYDDVHILLREDIDTSKALLRAALQPRKEHLTSSPGEKRANL